MNWDAVGAIAELLGATGVIATLVYLTTQIRQNTRALKASSMDSSTQSANDLRSSMFTNPDVVAVYYRGLANPADLDPIERERFRLIMGNVFWAIWNSFAQSSLGGNRAWEAQQNILDRVLRQPGGAWFWEHYCNEFDPEFAEEVNRRCALLTPSA